MTSGGATPSSTAQLPEPCSLPAGNVAPLMLRDLECVLRLGGWSPIFAGDGHQAGTSATSSKAITLSGQQLLHGAVCDRSSGPHGHWPMDNILCYTVHKVGPGVL